MKTPTSSWGSCLAPAAAASSGQLGMSAPGTGGTGNRGRRDREYERRDGERARVVGGRG